MHGMCSSFVIERVRRLRGERPSSFPAPSSERFARVARQQQLVDVRCPGGFDHLVRAVECLIGSIAMIVKWVECNTRQWFRVSPNVGPWRSPRRRARASRPRSPEKARERDAPRSRARSAPSPSGSDSRADSILRCNVSSMPALSLTTSTQASRERATISLKPRERPMDSTCWSVLIASSP